MFTLLVVPGLFATAALPAYGFGATVPPAAANPDPGQSFAVPATVTMETVVRDKLSATSPEELKARADRAAADAAAAAQAAAAAVRRTPPAGASPLLPGAAGPAATGTRVPGDSYPWPFALTDERGGVLSPLRYYYRECTDYVAWRLNLDAGSTSAPFRYTWANLTPGGGEASQWVAAWRSNGWATGVAPVPGAVAWFPGNHVGYVTDVLPGGRVLLEEYNLGNDHAYSSRIIPASSVPLFLAPPPR